MTFHPRPSAPSRGGTVNADAGAAFQPRLPGRRGRRDRHIAVNRFPGAPGQCHLRDFAHMSLAFGVHKDDDGRSLLSAKQLLRRDPPKRV
jgi:hypothetical protein